MPRRYTRKAKSIATKSNELMLAVPLVVGHRITRLAHAGPAPSARDLKEFSLMVSEKSAAFMQAWQAMGMQAMLANQALGMSFVRAFCFPFARGKVSPAKVAAQLHDAALGVFGKGLAPVHRKATANARRLARARSRRRA